MDAPEGYRYSTVIAIRYGDMDTLGHVNNAKYLTYLEQSRISYVRDLGLWNGGVSAVGMILARVEIDYRAAITMEDGEAWVWTRVSKLGGKSFETEHLILAERGGEIITAAQAKTVIVVYDYMRNATLRIPDAWREAVTAYEPALENE